MNLVDRKGCIEVICGPMFSGKTEALINRVKSAMAQDKKVQVFKPIIDDRYNPLFVNSHNGLSIDAISIKYGTEILQFLDKDADIIAIDEIQFFEKDILDVIKAIAKSGVRVITNGLDLDFRGEPFGLMPYVLALAEYIDKLTSICAICGKPATMTQRLVNDKPAKYNEPIILIGASDSYEPRCRNCHEIIKEEKKIELNQYSYAK